VDLWTKAGITAAAAVIAWGIAQVAKFGARTRFRFWIHQGVRIATTILWIVLVLRVWIEDTSRLGTIAAVIMAGLTVALQKVITSVAGYVSILRGSTFSIGDRITMGGVRGDVVALSYLRTTIMEMGQPPDVQNDEPAMWINGRQYTGRIVTITNDKIFDTPVYNYTREFPYVWEEIRIPVKHDADWRRVESILLDVATRHTADIVRGAREALPQLLHRFALAEEPRIEPETFVRITDNWTELTVRFLAKDHGLRKIKSDMSRDLLDALAASQIQIASATLEILGVGDNRP
jgi:small-conductance mechanosensitive channel